MVNWENRMREEGHVKWLLLEKGEMVGQTLNCVAHLTSLFLIHQTAQFIRLPKGHHAATLCTILASQSLG